MESVTRNVNVNETPETGSSWKGWVLAGAMAALVGANGFLFVRSSNLEAEVSRLRSSTSAEFQVVKEQSKVVSAETRKTLDQFNQQIEQQQAIAKQAAASARVGAQKHAEKLVRTLADDQKMEFEKAAAESAKLAEKLGAVETATTEHGTKMTEVAGEVGAVRTEVASTKSTLDQTIADLRSVRGDLGVQSGLVATNAKELAALRALGERNYYEFTITKKSPQVKVGNVMVNYRKADAKRNKFTVVLTADDKKIEKKDRTLNEPVQFYMSGSRTPYEIVVNEISKDKIVGYLATPKLLQAAR